MTRQQWKDTISAEEYYELLELSHIEPVGSDAILQQMAIAGQQFSGAKLEDLIVLSMKREQSAEEMARLMGWPGGDDSES